METPPGIVTPHIIRQAPGGAARDDNDWQSVRWNRDRHEGFVLGRYIQPPPMIFTADGHNAWMADMYRGRSAFLIASGPSFAGVDKTKLALPGVLTMGLNNSPKSFRPNMWTCVDSPSNFMRSIWLDPTIMKFVPICHTDKPLLDNDSGPRTNFAEWSWMKEKVRDCPNTWYYRRNEHFRAEQYLWEDTFNWGNHKDFGGARSVLLVAIRLLYLLGIRRVFLLGVDFNMSEENKYHFEQDRSKGSISGNNATYRSLNERFQALKPLFDQEGFQVLNCNPKSGLTAFPYAPFEEAIEEVLVEFGAGSKIDIEKENTVGLYDREDKEKKKREASIAAEVDQMAKREAEAGAKRYTDADRADAKARLDGARAFLETCKKETKALLNAEPKSPSGVEQWRNELRALQDREEKAREIFRRIEDEKRYLHGEPTRWGLWTPPGDSAARVRL